MPRTSAFTRPPYSSSGSQAEGLNEKHSHLATVVRVGGAVQQGRDRTAAGDRTVVELLDPVREPDPRGAGHVVEDPRARGRRVGRAVVRLEEEDRHLLP